MSNEMIKVVTENRLGIGANKIATNDSELSSGKLVKSTSTGISSADLSDHLEGTPGQITVSPHGTGGAKVGLATIGTSNTVGLDGAIAIKNADGSRVYYNCGSIKYALKTTDPEQRIFIRTPNYGRFSSTLITFSLAINSWDTKGLLAKFSLRTMGREYCYYIEGSTDKSPLSLEIGNIGTVHYLVIQPLNSFLQTADIMFPMLNVDTIKTNNNYIDNNPILDIKLEDDMDDLSTYETVYKFLLTGSLTSGQLDANGLPTGSRTLAWNTSIGSSSAPATLNVYGKSTLRDRLTVPKDGSNSTSGIIDVGDSYYLGGNRWIHNKGGITCTAVGYNALYSNGTGSSNSAMGSFALYGNGTGSNNSAMGYAALYNNGTGSYNSAMGYFAGRYIANGSTNKTTGDNNLYLGSGTKAKEDGTNNEIVIGANAIGLGSNSMVLGHTTNLLTALRGKVGIGTNAPEHGLHVGTNYNSDGNIKANNKLIAGTHVEAGGNVTAVETVQGKNINAVASGGVGGNITAHGDISADMYISAGKDITAGGDVNAGENVIADINVSAGYNIDAGNDITAVETVTGKNLVATQSITAGTTIDAGGNITSDGYVEGNYVRAVLKNGAGGDVTAANDVFANNNVEAYNHVIAQEEVKAGQAINTSEFTSLNNGEYLMDCYHNKLDIPLHLGNEAMICGIITNSRYDLTSEDILLDLPLGTNGRLFQVETMLAFRIIVSHSNSNEYILREETININSIISTLNDSTGYKIQNHKVISDLCVGYNIAQGIITAWESDYEYEDEIDSLLPSNFFTFEKTFLGAAKLKPKATLAENKIARLLYEAGFESYPYNIEYSYKINTNILGTNNAMTWAKK